MGRKYLSSVNLSSEDWNAIEAFQKEHGLSSRNEAIHVMVENVSGMPATAFRIVHSGLTQSAPGPQKIFGAFDPKELADEALYLADMNMIRGTNRLSGLPIEQGVISRKEWNESRIAAEAILARLGKE